jgi:hypothetical protein
MDEGFGRNLRTLFGDGTYRGIGERKLKSAVWRRNLQGHW